MRITYIITRFDETGGAQVHVHDLASALHERGHVPTVVTGSPGHLSRQLDREGIDVAVVPELVRDLQPRQDFAAVKAVQATLERFRPDVVSCHSSKAGVIGRLAAKRMGIPSVFTAHGWAFTQGIPRAHRLLYAAVEASVAPLASSIITVSAHDLELGKSWLPHARTRTRLIHNGVHDVGSELLADVDVAPPRGIFVGRFDRQKDHALALDVAARLPELRLSFVGSGPGRPDVERRVRELDLADRITFVGQSSNVAALLAQAQFFVLLSRWEGLPRSIIEAMRAGLPVVASDVGGVSELVTHGRTGLLVPRGDLPAAQEALAEVSASASLRRELGVAGRDRYQSCFTFDRMLRETLRAYEEVTALR